MYFEYVFEYVFISRMFNQCALFCQIEKDPTVQRRFLSEPLSDYVITRD